MPGFDILSPHLNLHQSHFLEASAGTGKTFAIEHIALRLLIEGLTLDKILVVTFTKAASFELKRRIRKTLDKAFNSLDDFPFLKGKSEEEYFLIKRKIQRALSLYDEARIMTIHSFCHSCLSEDDLEASLEKYDETFALTMVKDYLRTETPLAPFQMDKLLKAYQMNLDWLVKDLLHIALKRIPIDSPHSFKMQQESFLESMNIFQHGYESEKMYEDLLSYAFDYKGMITKSKEIKDDIREEIWHFSQGDTDISKYGRIIEMNEKNSLKRKKECQRHYPHLLQSMQKTIFPIIREVNDCNVLFACLAEEVRKHLLKEKKILFHDDLLLEMEKKIKTGAFKEKIRNQYEAVLIDEFQDTDFIQWRIFSELFLDAKKPLYLIGDPKQSIYRFRGADIYTYFQAKNTFSPERQFTLNRNYRSTPSLVDAMNTLFALRNPFLKLPKTQEPLTCPPVESDEKNAIELKEDGKGSIHFWQGQEEKDFFPYIVEEIRILSKEWKIPLNECAVLVKDRHQADRFQKYARKYHLHAVTKRSRPLTDSVAYQALIELLEGLSHLKQKGCIEKILGGALFSYPEEKIIREKEKELIRIFSLKEKLENEGILSFFISLMHEGLYEDILSRVDGVFFYSDFLQLIEILSENVQEKTAYLPYLKELSALPEESEMIQAYALGLEEMVPILTIHGSKGLEFEIVFSLGTALSSEMRKELIFDSKIKKLTLSEKVFEEEQKEAEAEKIRLFYVAATRAKKRLYLPYLSYESHAPLNLFLRGSEIPQTKTITQSFCVYHEPQLLEKEAEEKNIYPPDNFQSPFFEKCLVNSFSQMTQKSHHFKMTSFVNHIEAQGQGGRKMGQLIHKIFEKLPWDIARQIDNAELLEHYIQIICKQEGYEGSFQEICEMVFNGLHVKLPFLTSLSEIPSQNIMREASFLYKSSEGYLKGYIDLVFLFQDAFYIVDWKSNSLEDYTSKSLEEAMRMHGYHLQKEIYNEAALRFGKQWGKNFGGTFFIFLKGLSKEGQGIHFIMV